MRSTRVRSDAITGMQKLLHFLFCIFKPVFWALDRRRCDAHKPDGKTVQTLNTSLLQWLSCFSLKSPVGQLVGTQFQNSGISNLIPAPFSLTMRVSKWLWPLGIEKGRDLIWLSLLPNGACREPHGLDYSADVSDPVVSHYCRLKLHTHVTWLYPW